MPFMGPVGGGGWLKTGDHSKPGRGGLREGGSRWHNEVYGRSHTAGRACCGGYKV